MPFQKNGTGVLVSPYNVIEIKVFLGKQLNTFFFFVANGDELRQLIYLLLVLKIHNSI